MINKQVKNDDRDWKIQLNKWLKGRQVHLNFIFYVSTSNSLVVSGIHDGISILSFTCLITNHIIMDSVDINITI